VATGSSGARAGTAQAPGAGAQTQAAAEYLLRPAGWERLTDDERAALLRGFPALTTAAPAANEDAAVAMAPRSETPLQEWLAALVAPQFQRDLATGVRHWLESAPGDAHLFVGGDIATGRTSLVASLSRQAMAKRQQPPEYCYVPDPDHLGDSPIVLPLPKGTGAAFSQALGAALAKVAQQWQRSGGNGSSNGSGGDGDTQLPAQVLGPLEATSPAEARAYLARLRAALQAAPTGDDAPFEADSVPVLHVTPTPDDALSGAPVVVMTPRMEQADALLRANGGVLVVNVDNAEMDALLSALRSRALVVKDGWPPVPLTTRVALVGGEGAYEQLWSGEVAQVFRYEAWGSDFTAWTREAEAVYAAFAAGVAARYGLPPFDPTGVARLVEEGARRTDSLSRARLTTDLRLLHDLAYEAALAAQARGSAATTGAEVEAALLQRRRPHRGLARTVREAILSGENMTPTSGATIGQINGLAIIEWHPDEASVAVPTRISATVTPGREEQLIDVEREAAQADASHVRGEMTVEGYLAARYGQQLPLAFAARVRFEQEHGGMGGDSASLAMLLALLSALAQVPIRRSIAVTGAVGQYGEVQPVGGVNTKIEGFYELAQARRAAGEQVEGGYGVVIPRANLRDVMLRREVAHAIASEGWFQVWAAGTVDEAIQLLMGYPADALHKRIEARLARFAQIERKRGVR
jgi:hypothetical protein